MQNGGLAGDYTRLLYSRFVFTRQCPVVSGQRGQARATIGSVRPLARRDLRPLVDGPTPLFDIIGTQMLARQYRCLPSLRCGARLVIELEGIVIGRFRSEGHGRSRENLSSIVDDNGLSLEFGPFGLRAPMFATVCTSGLTDVFRILLRCNRRHETAQLLIVLLCACHPADRIIAEESANERALKSDEPMTAGYSPPCECLCGRQVTGGQSMMAL
uniref:Uncharacterized protein n=1 Tax=Plectus sambesii TaxID=2011161 RepID=A0A914UMQ1_9BILA